MLKKNVHLRRLILELQMESGVLRDQIVSMREGEESVKREINKIITKFESIRDELRNKDVKMMEMQKRNYIIFVFALVVVVHLCCY